MNKLLSLIASGFLFIPIAIVFWKSPAVIDQYSEIKWTVFYLVSSLVAISFFLNPSLLRLPNIQSFKVVAILTALSYFASALLNFPGSYEKSLLDWLCFIILFLASYSADSEPLFQKIKKANLIATLIILTYAAFQMMGLEPISYLARWTKSASLFGNVNITAEFIAISALIQLQGFRQQNLEAIKREYFRISILILSVLYLFYLFGRSALVAFFAGVFVLYAPKQYSRNTKRILVCAGALTALALVPILFPKSGFLKSELAASKSDSGDIRMIRWKNTVEMIKARPLGVGPDNFKFAYLSFARATAKDVEASERGIMESPHNGYLEVAAENGVITLALLMMLLCLIVLKLNSWPRAIIVFVIVDAFFAFPMNLAYPFFALAVFLGMAVRLSLPTVELTGRPGTKLLQGVATFMIALYSAMFVFAFHVETNLPDDLELNSAACNLVPSRWQLCLRKALLEFENELYARAEDTSQTEILKQPNNFLALDMLATIYTQQLKTIEACKVLQRYDELFYNTSSLHAKFESMCVIKK